MAQKIIINCFFNILFLLKHPLKFSHISTIFRLKYFHFVSLNKIKIIDIYFLKLTIMKIIFHKIKRDDFLLFKA